jgi:hypothetical protein
MYLIARVYANFHASGMVSLLYTCYNIWLLSVHFFVLIQRNEPKKNQGKTMLQRSLQNFKNSRQSWQASLPEFREIFHSPPRLARCFAGPALKTDLKLSDL